jgi:hypothetical protein
MTWRRRAVAVCLALSDFFSWFCYIRYWKWRDCINAVLSSCITPEGDNLTSGGMIWGLFALAFLAAALCLALRK